MEVLPYELNVFEMQKQISQGNLDLGFMTLFESQRDNNGYQNLYGEEILIRSSPKLGFWSLVHPWRKQQAGSSSSPGIKRPSHDSIAQKRQPCDLSWINCSALEK